MARRDERDWFAEDIAPLFWTDEPIPFQLTERAIKAIRANTRRARARRCASRSLYVHGGPSW